MKKRWFILLFLCLIPFTVSAENEETLKAPRITRVVRTETKATVSWEVVEGAEGYRLQYGTDPKFSPEHTCTIKLRGPGNVHRHIEKLKPGGTYYFRVQAGNKEQKSRWSRRQEECQWFKAEPIPDDVFQRMRGKSYPQNDKNEKIRRSELKYLSLWHVGFDGNEHQGEMICHADVAEDMVDVFYELYRRKYSIESIRLIDDFDADDHRSMASNNSSCFCYRYIGDTDMLSSHALGRAVDINPLYNPQVVLDEDTKELLYVDPEEASGFADRDKAFPHKIDENDLAYRLFTDHGFLWGGVWEDENDYMHFEKPEEGLEEEEDLSMYDE